MTKSQIEFLYHIATRSDCTFLYLYMAFPTMKITIDDMYHIPYIFILVDNTDF